MFGRGKFDLYKRSVSVLLQAVGQLITQIPSQDDFAVYLFFLSFFLFSASPLVFSFVLCLCLFFLDFFDFV